MVKISPAAGRAQVREDGRGIEIVIPARRQAYVIAFLGFWLVCWAAAEGIVPAVLLRRELPTAMRAFVAGWLCLWTLGGVLIIYLWLWMLVGKEVIRLDGATLSVKRDVLGAGRTREFEWAHVADLRPSPDEASPWLHMSRWGYRPMLPEPGRILFDYGAKTYRFGGGVDAPEARDLIERMTARYTLSGKRA